MKVRRVHLERPALRREVEYLQGVRSSRKLHRGFVTTPTTSAEYRDYLRRTRRPDQESYFVIFTAEDALVGVVNVNEIVRHAFQSGRLGFYAFAPYAGAGLMREGLALVVAAGFGELGLHRLEANIRPENERSIALVRRLGFRFEGLSPRYLKIGRRWLDHERWALLADEWPQPRRSRAASSSTMDALARVGER